MKLIGNVHVDKKRIKGIKGPFILICNHGARIDPVYVYTTMFPRVLNFVGSYGFFKNKFLNWYFTKLGSIPKFQYQTDLSAMKDMISVTRNNGILAMHPAGRMPSCGRGFMIPEGLSKLIKICKVPVVCCLLHGTYLTKPKWAINKRRGRIEIEYYPLLSKEDVENLDTDAINKIVNEALDFNDYEWNRTKQYKFGKKDLAIGLETTLYRCPRCHKEFNMKTYDNTIECDSCHTKFEITPTGYFKSNMYYEHPDQWFEGQRESIDEFIKNNELLMQDNTKVILTGVNNLLDQYGYGKVSLYSDHLNYIGTINNENVDINIDLTNLFSLPYKAGNNFEISDGPNIYKFELDNGLHAAKYCQVVEELYKLRNK